MMRSALWVLLLLVLPPLALPCGPYFNDGHFGLLRDERLGSLERVYAALLRPDQPREQLIAAAHAAMVEAFTAEERRQWAAARAAWQRALDGLGFDAVAQRHWQLRYVHDRIDVLAAVGGAISADDFARYAGACGMIAPGAADESPPKRDALIELAAGGNAELAAAALTTLAWQELRQRDLAEARIHLDAALARSPQGIKSDEAGYLRAVAPLFAHLDGDGHVDEPRACLDAIQAWLDQHAGSPWRMHALGWQAAILYRQRGLAWGEDPDGLLAATRIWQHQLTAGQGWDQFTTAVESLRLAYRLLRPAPPPWVIADPRHAAAFAWHALSDRGPAGERATVLRTAIPAMARLAAATNDAQILEVLASGYDWAGIPAAALPLATRALALHDVPDLRYQAARLNAQVGDPALGERLAEPLAADPRYFDLLVRCGAGWELRKEWGRALHDFTRANSQVDVAILADGEMPLASLAALVAGGGPFTAAIDDGWFGEVGRKAGFDYLPMLRTFLATRLVRADRAREALPFFAGELRGLCAGLVELQDALATATDAQRADRLWALASFWYDPARKLVFSDRSWHQWADHAFADGEGKPRPGREADYQRLGAELEAMTVYWRAYPLFLEIADRYPGDIHAPEALYHAALCRYWLTGQTYLKYCRWWLHRAQQEGFWAQGDALLKRLGHAYPDHPLARDAKVLKAMATP